MSLRALGLAAMASCVFGLTACTNMTPNYAPSVANIQAIKDAGSPPVKVGTFTEDPGTNEISLRANSMVSSVNSSYGAYLAEAMRQELAIAKALDPNAGVEVTGDLTQNEVNVPMSTGSANIAARFVVKKGDVVKFDKVKSASTTFESSFAAATAIPNAVQSYPLVVQKLLAALYADPEFFTALKQ